MKNHVLNFPFIYNLILQARSTEYHGCNMLGRAGKGAKGFGRKWEACSQGRAGGPDWVLGGAGRALRKWNLSGVFLVLGRVFLREGI